MLRFHEKKNEFKKKTKKNTKQKQNKNFNCSLWRQSAWKCILKKKLRVLSKEFESIETSPRFAQLLGENWNQNQ